MHGVQRELLIVVITKANTAKTRNDLLGEHCSFACDDNAPLSEGHCESLRATAC